MVSSDEPIVFDYSCSTDPTERPACAVALPLMERGENAPLHQWAVPVEQRSLDTLRPIHNQILQVARLRVCQVARYLRLSLGLQGWLPKYVCQAKTDALLCAFPKRLVPEIKKLRELPLRALGVDSDEPALRVSFEEVRWMKDCGNIRQEHPRPKIPKHTLVEEIPENEDFVLCLLYTSPSPRDRTRSRMPSSA